MLANIALSVLDEQAPWKPGGTMASEAKRAYRRRKGAPTWRLVRYADDFVVLLHGTKDDTEVMREQVEQVLSPLGLRLSPEKTVVRHLSDGVDFLGFHIQWRRKRGSDKWFVYTFVGDRPIRSLKAKVRALTHRGSQQSLDYVIMRLNQILRGWSNYFKHAVAKARFTALQHFVWQRVIRMLQTRHRWGWKDIRRRYTTASGRWLPISATDGTQLFDMGNVTVSRYRWRGHRIPNRWTTLQLA